MISLESSESVTEPAEPEPWMRILTVHSEEKMDQKAGAKLSGPTFKVNIMVEGVKTRALLDNGSQVTLVRVELFPKIKGWKPEQQSEQDSNLTIQPIGACGKELGATSVVNLCTTMEQTGQELVIPCFVLQSSKPIWQGVVHDCAMVLGTNAMTEYGVQTVQADGTIVEPFSPTKGREGTPEHGARRVYLAPGAAQKGRVRVEQDGSVVEQPCESEIGVVVPT